MWFFMCAYTCVYTCIYMYICVSVAADDDIVCLFFITPHLYLGGAWSATVPGAHRLR